MINLAPLILLFPLAGFALTGLFGRSFPREAHRFAMGGVVASWAVAMVVALAALSHGFGFGEHGVGITVWHWIPAIGFTADVGLYVDSLTACLLLVVTTIGMLVHVYSLGYMEHDPGRWRVFAGWELVGLCSYLLIGFWYPRRSAAVAAKKAFLVNRVGDMGFALGIMAI